MEKELPIGLRFSLLHRSFKKQLDEQLKEKELTGVQFGVLGQLGRLERSGQGEVYQKDLELATHVTHPTMTEIVKRLEKGDVPLDASLALFEEGSRLLAACNEMLDTAEQKVVQLKKGNDGAPVELPFETEE